MLIFHQNVDLALTLAMWERQRESLCENRNSMSSFNQQSCFFIKNIEFSLEKCRFGATKGVLHYAFRREIEMLAKKYNFELEICVKARGERTARCMGDVPVAEMLASEARQPSHAGGTRGGARRAADDPTYCLFAGDRSRESCGTWQLPQNMQ